MVYIPDKSEWDRMVGFREDGSTIVYVAVDEAQAATAEKEGSLRLDKHPEFATPDIINRVKRVERTLAQLRRSYLEECEVMLIESQTKLKQAYRIIPELEWFLEGACVRAVCFNEKPPSRNSLAGSLAVCGECEVDGCRVRCAAISLQRILEVETDGEDAQSAMEGVT